MNTKPAKRLSRASVLARMRKGDLPYPLGYGQVRFSDGAKASPKVIAGLLRDGLIHGPAHASVHSPYTLAGARAQ